ncbi:hypothetical protein [Motilibacter deserti]|uniref:PknH-like protein n=1 Tax=Motilibacter deserti TaxID=2714956 RepID=A0ABX0H1Y3_9ACTN|nr:hypothetical protein [Motilibacter deserti]NHC15945.1 hypothetical protein [Motilibacter deserti]
MRESLFPELERLRDDLGPEPLPGAADARQRGRQRSRRASGSLGALALTGVVALAAAATSGIGGGAAGTPGARPTADPVSYDLMSRARTLAPDDLPGPRQVWGHWSVQSLLPSPLQDRCAAQALTSDDGTRGLVTMYANFIGAEGRTQLSAGQQATTAYESERSAEAAYRALGRRLDGCADNNAGWTSRVQDGRRMWLHFSDSIATRTVVLVGTRDRFVTVLGLEIVGPSRGQAPEASLAAVLEKAVGALGTPADPTAQPAPDAFRPGTDALIPAGMWPKGDNPADIVVGPDKTSPCPLTVPDRDLLQQLERGYGAYRGQAPTSHERLVVLGSSATAQSVFDAWNGALARCSTSSERVPPPDDVDDSSPVYAAVGTQGKVHKLMAARVGNILVLIRFEGADADQVRAAMSLAVRGAAPYVLPEPPTG